MFLILFIIESGIQLSHLYTTSASPYNTLSFKLIIPFFSEFPSFSILTVTFVSVILYFKFLFVFSIFKLTSCVPSVREDRSIYNLYEPN